MEHNQVLCLQLNPVFMKAVLTALFNQALFFHNNELILTSENLSFETLYSYLVRVKSLILFKQLLDKSDFDENDLQQFLKQHWKCMQVFNHGYDYFAKTAYSKLFLGIAKLILMRFPDQPLYKILMPTLELTEDHIGIYPDLADLKWDHIVLSDQALSALPLEMLSYYLNPCLELPLTLQNPYQPSQHLSPAEQGRLFRATKEGSEAYDKHLFLQQFRAQQNTMGTMLQKLRDGLRAGGVSHAHCSLLLSPDKPSGNNLPTDNNQAFILTLNKQLYYLQGPHAVPLSVPLTPLQFDVLVKEFHVVFPRLSEHEMTPFIKKLSHDEIQLIKRISHFSLDIATNLRAGVAAYEAIAAFQNYLQSLSPEIVSQLMAITFNETTLQKIWEILTGVNKKALNCVEINANKIDNLIKHNFDFLFPSGDALKEVFFQEKAHFEACLNRQYALYMAATAIDPERLPLKPIYLLTADQQFFYCDNRSPLEVIHCTSEALQELYRLIQIKPDLGSDPVAIFDPIEPSLLNQILLITGHATADFNFLPILPASNFLIALCEQLNAYFQLIAQQEVYQNWLNFVPIEQLLQVVCAEKNTLLHIAVDCQNEQLIKNLKPYQALMTQQNAQGNTAFEQAVSSGSLAIAQLLVAIDSNSNQQVDNLLMKMSIEGELVGVNILLACQADVTLSNLNIDNNSALHLAALNGHYEIVKRLITAFKTCSLNIDYRNTDQRTALHLAASKGQLTVMKYLVAQGASIMALDNQARLPLMDAIDNGNLQAVGFLMDAVENISADEVFQPLIYAIGQGKHEVVNLLLTSQIILKTLQGSQAGTYLFYAAQCGNPLVVEMLLQVGIDPNFSYYSDLASLKTFAQTKHVTATTLPLLQARLAAGAQEECIGLKPLDIALVMQPRDLKIPLLLLGHHQPALFTSFEQMVHVCSHVTFEQAKKIAEPTLFAHFPITQLVELLRHTSSNNKIIMINSLSLTYLQTMNIDHFISLIVNLEHRELQQISLITLFDESLLKNLIKTISDLIKIICCLTDEYCRQALFYRLNLAWVESLCERTIDGQVTAEELELPLTMTNHPVTKLLAKYALILRVTEFKNLASLRIKNNTIFENFNFSQKFKNQYVASAALLDHIKSNIPLTHLQLERLTTIPILNTLWENFLQLKKSKINHNVFPCLFLPNHPIDLQNYPGLQLIQRIGKNVDFNQNHQYNEEHRFKVVFLGDIGCGRTALLRRLRGINDIRTRSTIGVDFTVAHYLFESQVIQTQIWDVSGQERFGTLMRVYLKDLANAIFAFDLTRKSTFKGVSKWIDVVNSLGPSELIGPFILVGLKADLVHAREVSDEDIADLVTRENLVYVTASAKTGMNVEELMQFATLQTFFKNKMKEEHLTVNSLQI